MKKKLAKTKCTAKLRKSEYHNEWYLILESYPVFKAGSDKAQFRTYSLTVIAPVARRVVDFGEDHMIALCDHL